MKPKTTTYYGAEMTTKQKKEHIAALERAILATRQRAKGYEESLKRAKGELHERA